MSALRQKMSAPPTTKNTTAAAASTASPPGTVELGLRLLHLLNTRNAVLSPICVRAALELAALGTKPNTPAANELAAALGAAPPKTNVKALTTATAAFVSSDVHASFIKIAAERNAQVAPLSTNVDPINKWVSEATKGLIKSILDSVPPNAAAVLLSAAHFAAQWASAFDPDDTSDEYFASAEGEQQVRMMCVTKKRFNYVETDISGVRVQALRMPYQGADHCSAVVILPAAGTSLDTLVSTLGKQGGATAWMTMCEGMRMTMMSNVSMPRFRAVCGGSIADEVKALGVRAAFNAGALDALADGAAISDVVHKACIECDEKGTVAAAAVAVLAVRSMRVDRDPAFVCDRPFLFAVTMGNELLFVARIDKVLDPA